MKRQTVHFLYVLLLAAASSVVVVSESRAQISVVVSAQSDVSATGTELKQIFLGQKLRWENGKTVHIVDHADQSIGKTFCDKFLGLTYGQVHENWNRLIMTGNMRAPRRQQNDAAVRAAVAENPSAVGFISTSAVDGSVKELYRILSFGK